MFNQYDIQSLYDYEEKGLITGRRHPDLELVVESPPTQEKQPVLSVSSEETASVLFICMSGGSNPQ